MSVAARYLNRELAGIFLVTLVLLLMVAVGGRFIGYLQEAALGKFTGTTVLTIIYLRLPEFIQLVSPFALYVAIVLTFGRLFAEQEMVVLQGAGASTGQVVRWSAYTVCAVTLAVSGLALYLTPISQQTLVAYMAEQRAQTEFETVNPGIFHIYDRGNRVTYSEAMSDDRRELFNVFLAQRLEDGRQALVWASRGTQRLDDAGNHYLVLHEGRRYEGTPGTPDYRVVQFGEMLQRLEGSVRPRRVEVEAVPTGELSDDPKSQAEWHWRLALPLFCIIGSVLGLAISRVKPRQGRFAKVVPGMLIMLLYYLVLLMGRNAIDEGQLPSAIGLWPLHAAFAAFALWQLRRLARPVST